MILLSICIATYNRGNYIGETLDSIVYQLTDDVEVVVVDGASTDNTEDVINNYLPKCKQLRYKKLNKKGGVDHDFSKSVEFAKGKYCWLFPDDDLLKPGAVRAVLDNLKKNYCLIIVNAQVMSIDFSRTLQNRILPIYVDEIFDKFEIEILFKRVIEHMSFIGCVVIKRDFWNSREKIKYMGTEFIHVGVVFQDRFPGSTLVMSEPYIKIRYGNAQWSSRSIEISLFKWPRLLMSFKKISLPVRKMHQIQNPLHIIKSIAVYRAKGIYNLDGYKKLEIIRDLPIIWKCVAHFLAIFPSSILNIFALSYYKIIKKNALITIYELESYRNKILSKLEGLN